MPIRVQNDLPVKEILEKENIFVMDENRAVHQDIRPIKIGLLNLMPLKEDTELQLLRSLSNTPLQVDVTFMAVESHQAKNTSVSHLNKFYQTFPDLRDQKFDGMIVTGAPVERPECVETTAMGAAYLAGIAVGYWKDKEDVRKNRAVDHTFTPAITEEERKKRLKGWNKAVRYAFDWARDEE